jgi:hypothetical protein
LGVQKLDRRAAAPGIFLSVADGGGGHVLRQLTGNALRGCGHAMRGTLYDPLYSFYVTSPVEVGELICFVGLALIGAKCAADLLQPLLSWQQQNPAAEE